MIRSRIAAPLQTETRSKDGAADPAWPDGEPAPVLPGRGRGRRAGEEAPRGGRQLAPRDVGTDELGPRLRLPDERVEARGADVGPASFVLCLRRRRQDRVRRQRPRRGEEHATIGAGVRPGGRSVDGGPRHGGGARRAARALRRR
jgi:hypothetical protein